MAKKWYPVIDYLFCKECGTCSGMCPHGVYDLAASPTPRVVHPENCVDHCHGCGTRCPAGAITYVGEDTGWMPPNGQKSEGDSTCCSCGCEIVRDDNRITIEYLYLDLNTCDRCIGTDKTLDEVVKGLTPAFKLAGFGVDYKKIEITNADIAKQYHFLSSPTIRVNGQDICASISESDCDCCSEISGTSTDCRVFEYEGQIYEIPPAEMLARGILKAVFKEEKDSGSGVYELPENLKRFFNGKELKQPHCDCNNA